MTNLVPPQSSTPITMKTARRLKKGVYRSYWVRCLDRYLKLDSLDEVHKVGYYECYELPYQSVQLEDDMLGFPFEARQNWCFLKQIETKISNDIKEESKLVGCWEGKMWGVGDASEFEAEWDGYLLESAKWEALVQGVLERGIQFEF